MSEEQLLLLQMPEDDDESISKLNEDPKRSKSSSAQFKGKEKKVQNVKYAAAGASNILKQWPSYVGKAVWLVLGIIIVLALLFLLFHWISKRCAHSHEVDKKKCFSFRKIGRALRGKLKRCKSPKNPNEICQTLLNRERALLELGYLDPDTQQSFSLITDNNVFHIHNGNIPLNYIKACAIESAVRYAPDKQFFLIKLTKCPQKSGQDWDDAEIPKNNFTAKNISALLKNKYPNFRAITTDGCKYFRGSPFQDFWQDGYDLVYFAAQVLTIWRFGGTVLSLNALIANRKLFDQSEGSVEISQLILRSRLQCNNFIHKLMLEIKNKMESTNLHAVVNPLNYDPISEVIDKSLENYCHNPTGCQGVKKMEDSKICNRLDEQCFILNFKNWRKQDLKWKRFIKAFCPIMAEKSSNFSIGDEEM